MPRGSGAGLIRVPNYGGGPLFTITGNFPASGGPRAPTSSDTNINGGTNPYVFAPMWEAKGLKNWFFYAIAKSGASFTSGGGIWVMGTLDQKTVVNPALTTAWFSLSTEATGAGGPGGKNPLFNSGDQLDFDKPLYGITIVVANFTGSASSEWDFYAEAAN